MKDRKTPSVGKKKQSGKSSNAPKSPPSVDATVADAPHQSGGADTRETAKARKKSKAVKGKSPDRSAIKPKKEAKPITVALDNGDQLQISGEKTLSGRDAFRITDGRIVCHVLRQDFVGSGRSGIDSLTKAGIIIIGSPKHVIMAAAQVKHFPLRTIVERSGWTGGVFANPAGAVFSAASDKPVAMFDVSPGACDRAGTLKAWRRGVAKPLTGQNVAMFFLMLPFAAPLLAMVKLPFNPGFELAAAAGMGKSTLLALTASVAGPGVDGGSGQYWMTLNATANGLETALARHADMPMILEEAALYSSGSGADARARAFAELIFKLSSGSGKARFGDSTQLSSRFVYSMSTNTPWATMLGSRHPELHTALHDRLMTIVLDSDRPFGTFDFLPEPRQSASEFAATLVAAASENYGVALPAFLQKLVEERAKDPSAFDKFLDRQMKLFLRRVGVDQNDGSAVRVAKAFGIVYIAGVLAKRYGVLPRRYECLRAVRTCYDLHRTTGRPMAPAWDRLVALTQRSDVIDADNIEIASVSVAAQTASGFWKTNRSGQREFLMTAAQARRAFPDWDVFQDEPAIAAVRSSDAGTGRRKRKLDVIGQAGWYFCFIMPQPEEA